MFALDKALCKHHFFLKITQWGIISILIWQKRTWKHRKVKQLAQGHSARKHQSWDLNSGPSDSSILYYTSSREKKDLEYALPPLRAWLV